MNAPHRLALLVLCYLLALQAAVVQKKDVNEISAQGLYSRSNKVIILAKENYDQLIYGQKQAWLVQFYNSFCGHCRAFYPKFKQFAADVEHWTRAVRVAVVDCSVEDNIEICRQFEVMQYPSLRYFHENYVKGNTNIGERLDVPHDPDILTSNLLSKLKDEQSRGRLAHVPSLAIAAYNTYADALKDVPTNIKYTFLVFETLDSTVGSMLILDTCDYESIAVKRVLSTSQLSQEQGVNRLPSLIAVRNDLQATPLTPKNPTRASLLHAIDIFLESKNVPLPSRESSRDYYDVEAREGEREMEQDGVYLADLETALRTSLHTEIVRHKMLQGDTLRALIQYLAVLIDYFPFRSNGKEFLVDLKGTLAARDSWAGQEVAEVVGRLERAHAPVYASQLEYAACRGSEARYRGYTCALWTTFHTLTVAAATQSGGSARDVLLAMRGYVEHFFGCSDCVQHFLEMAQRNKLSEVRDNDKAVLWLWIAHNEVNLRLAGDSTEDPHHPKMQYPSAAACADCRLARGAWRLPAVYRYLLQVYAPAAVRAPAARARSPSAPLSALDLTITAFLYIFSFTIILLVCKMFFSRTRRLLINRAYRHRSLSTYRS